MPHIKIKKSPVTPPGIDPGTFRLVAQCLNHYVTTGPDLIGLYTHIIVPIHNGDASLKNTKIPSDTTGDRSRDLPTSSAVP
jgi:hypothetical protein